MKIGKHGLRDHVRLLGPPICLIASVFFLRIILACAQSPAWVIRMCSVTLATAVASLLAVVLIHVRQFGSYASVVVAAFLLNLWSELLIVSAITVSVVLGVDNIYTAAEYTPIITDINHTRHIRGHLTFGIGTGTLVGAGVGCLLLLLLRVFTPRRKEPSSWDLPQQ